MLEKPKGLLERVRRRLESAPLSAYVRGALLRRRFTRAGLLTVWPGRPRIQVINRGGEIVTENCGLYPGVRLECLPGGKIFLGNGTYLNRNTEIISECSVHLGRDCMIAWDVVIMDTDQHGMRGGPGTPRAVFIGDRVWIGCRAIILKGVTIGDGAIIGAGAIVTKDVPAGAIAYGVSASVHGYAGAADPSLVPSVTLSRPDGD